MKFDHYAVQVTDMDQAIAFYTHKMSFKLNSRAINEEEKEEYAFLSYEGLRLELIKDLGNEYKIPEIKKPYCPHIAIETDDMQRTVNELRNNGVNIIKGPLKIENEETWVYFADEDNNILEYIQWYNKK